MTQLVRSVGLDLHIADVSDLIF